MVRVEVEISNAELDSLEDLAVLWNLCEKHKAVINATEDDRWHFTQTCEKCVDKNRKISFAVLHVWCKLVTAYEKARKNKRVNARLR